MVHIFLSACLCLVEDITKEKALLTSALIFENFINYVTQGWRLKFTTFYFTFRLYPNNVYSNKITSKNECLYLFHCKQSQKTKRYKLECFRAWQENFCLIKSFIVTYQRISRGRNKDYLVINWLFYVKILQIQRMATM